MIPIFIIARDRHICLVELCDYLVAIGQERVTIVDNDSTYPELLDWYETSCPYTVLRLPDNEGHLAPWRLELVPDNEPYAVTDPDVIPIAECPPDLLEHMTRAMKTRALPKVGLSLKIDDLPPNAHAALKWEQQFWTKKLGASMYDAPVDTTMAVYRPGVLFAIGGARCAPPYTARHTTWYLDPDNMPADEIWYRSRLEPSHTHWSGQR